MLPPRLGGAGAGGAWGPELSDFDLNDLAKNLAPEVAQPSYIIGQPQRHIQVQERTRTRIRLKG